MKQANEQLIAQKQNAESQKISSVEIERIRAEATEELRQFKEKRQNELEQTDAMIAKMQEDAQNVIQ